MYITESIKYDKNTGRVALTLIWKTPDSVFPYNPTRYRDNRLIATIPSAGFAYTRRGQYLVGTYYGNPVSFPLPWTGVGEWRIDSNIRAM